MSDAENYEIVEVELGNGRKMKIQATVLEDRKRRKITDPVEPPEPEKFKQVTDVIEGVAIELDELLEKIKPQKASVEFALQIAVESSGIVAMLVKGSAKADLKITLEWSRNEPKRP